MSVLRHQGATLHYREAGQGLPLLLLHGFPLTSDSFWPQVEALSGKFRLIIPDHRGFGESEGGDQPTTMDAIAWDALAILDALAVPTAVVAGVSMGGYAALALTRLDPGRVKALVLIDTQVGADDTAGKAKREETAKAVEQKGMAVLVESMMPKLLGPGAPPEVRARVEKAIADNSPKGAAAALRGMALRPDSREIVARFAGPILVMVGAEDVITPRANAEEIAGLNARAQLVELPGAGHLSNLEAPEAFNRALEDWLNRLS